MRINGFEQIKAFYSWVFNNQGKNVSTSHISLYCFLINQNNRSNWVEWFKLPYDLGMSGACIGSRNTYYKCLQDLSDWKLIEYKKGINNYKAPIIKLCLLKSEQVTEQAPVPLSEQVTEQLCEQLTEPLTEPLTEHKYKLLTNNLKRITFNIDEVLSFLDILENSDGEYKIIEKANVLTYKKLMQLKSWHERLMTIFEFSGERHLLNLLDQFLTVELSGGTIKKSVELQDHFVRWVKKEGCGNIKLLTNNERQTRKNEKS